MTTFFVIAAVLLVFAALVVALVQALEQRDRAYVNGYRDGQVDASLPDLEFEAHTTAALRHLLEGDPR